MTKQDAITIKDVMVNLAVLTVACLSWAPIIYLCKVAIVLCEKGWAYLR